MRLRPFGMALPSTPTLLGLPSSLARQGGGWINPDESMPAADVPAAEADEGVAGSDQRGAEAAAGGAGTPLGHEMTAFGSIPRGQCRLPDHAASGSPTVRRASSRPPGLAISWRRGSRPEPSWWAAKQRSAYLSCARRLGRSRESQRGSGLLSCFLTRIDPLVRRALVGRPDVARCPSVGEQVVNVALCASERVRAPGHGDQQRKPEDNAAPQLRSNHDCFLTSAATRVTGIPGPNPRRGGLRPRESGRRHADTERVPGQRLGPRARHDRRAPRP